MYNNCGAKIKGIVSVIAGLGMVASIVVGLIVLVSNIDYGGLIAGPLIAAGGCLGSWLGGLMLAAFGEMVENTYEIRKMLTAMQSGQVAAPAPKQNIPYVEAALQQQKEAKPEPEMKTAPVDPVVNAEKVCYNCGAVNKSGKFCYKCGSKLY